MTCVVRHSPRPLSAATISVGIVKWGFMSTEPLVMPIGGTHSNSTPGILKFLYFWGDGRS
jgi:hypothetical protein